MVKTTVRLTARTLLSDFRADVTASRSMDDLKDSIRFVFEHSINMIERSNKAEIGLLDNKQMLSRFLEQQNVFKRNEFQIRYLKYDPGKLLAILLHDACQYASEHAEPVHHIIDEFCAQYTKSIFTIRVTTMILRKALKVAVPTW